MCSLAVLVEAADLFVPLDTFLVTFSVKTLPKTGRRNVNLPHTVLPPARVGCGSWVLLSTCVTAVTKGVCGSGCTSKPHDNNNT